jgi:phthiocerol/phenolphthiocerol synthesis type-I polyketide synthase E
MEQSLRKGCAVSPVDRSNEGTPYEDPRGETEQAIASVWREVFGFERIGRDDNFFELGGNSLLGMTLVETLGRRLNVELPVVTLFLNPTIREVAGLVGMPVGG